MSASISSSAAPIQPSAAARGPCNLAMKFPLYMTGQCPHIARSGGPRRSYLAPLTPGLGLTIIRGLRELHTYQLPLDLVRERPPERPVAIARPDAVAVAARWFQENFKGDVFYAVKANPSPWVIKALVENGVTSFDVASYQTYRIGLQVITYLIFLWSYVQYIHIDHRDGNVLITDSAYKLFGYDSFFLQVAAYYIADGAE